jgi:hypothetical protein
MVDFYQQMLEEPSALADLPYDEAFRLPPERRDEIQLAGIRRRFSQLRGRIAGLDRLADEQNLADLTGLDDVVPLLFPHTVYKSYPLSFLERGRFDALTRWLGGLTSIDLRHVDLVGVTSIDQWLQRLDDQTPLMVNHTFGTSGKLSFIPRTKDNWRTTNRLQAHALRDWGGANSGPDLLQQHLPLIAPTYRFGYSTSSRSLNMMVKNYSGGDHNALFLYPDDAMSADVASLAGRLKAAEDRGEQGQLELAPSLLARREEFARRERDRPQALKNFFDRVQQDYAGKDIFLFSFWPLLSDWAEEGLSRGLRKLFGSGSLLMSGGGTKGRKLPERWRERVREFVGFERTFDTFGMSEMCGGCNRCEHGRYHLPPTWVAFVLDLETGRPMTRTGRQTGRFAVMDLFPDTYWGGFITGDLVTIGGWTEPCDCGRTGPYLEPDIKRVSDVLGGEDKISCAGVADAHDKAIDYLVGRSAA